MSELDPLPSYIEPRAVVVGYERRPIAPLDWRVLHALWQRRDRVSTLEELLAAVYPPPKQPPTDGNVLKVAFSHLRAALVGTPLRIEWVWRRGYRVIDSDSPVAVAPAPPAVAPTPPAVAPPQQRIAKPKPFGASGCRYLVAVQDQCGKRQQAGSPYCPEHHSLCYLPISSPRERRRLREIDRIGDAVGGRQSPTGEMTSAFQRRIEQLQGNA